MADIKVGTILHYYDKIGVAVLEVTEDVSVGDTIRITGHDQEFTQTIESMQVEHESLETAKKGQTVGLKVSQEAHEGDEVYKTS